MDKSLGNYPSVIIADESRPKTSFFNIPCVPVYIVSLVIGQAVYFGKSVSSTQCCFNKTLLNSQHMVLVIVLCQLLVRLLESYYSYHKSCFLNYLMQTFSYSLKSVNPCYL
jgi:hypothetical protein